ncbi:MAG: hypothetical protein PHU53_03285 [Thermoplasmata archaeon]|nr:hypothetical protein [Thermoplasmata archaeon]
MSESGRHGTTYRNLCILLGKSKPDGAKRRKLSTEIRRLQADARTLAARAVSLRLSDAGPKESAKLQTELAAKEKALAKLIRVSEQKEFMRAMRITGMGLRVGEVVRFSAVIAILSLLLAIAIAFPSAMWFGLDPMMVLAVTAACAISVPLSVFMLLVNYPERLARSLEMEAFGAAPEVVNYMVMSMELSPSIDRAVLFAAENAAGTMSDELKTLVWKVKAREFATTDEALQSYAGELEAVNEDLRSAIYNILSATKERDHDKARSGLRRASDTVLTGTRQRVEGFAASLGTPATVLFSLGILLPMIIGSMLPMISMGGFQMAPGDEPQAAESWAPMFVLSVLLMNVVFPAIAIVYAISILARRPGISGSAQPPKETSGAVGAVLIISLFTALAFVCGTTISFWGLEWAIASLVMLFGIATGLWFGLRQTSDADRSKEAEKLESQMPDMLFQLGSRLGEGIALERALEDVSGTMEKSEMGDFLAGVLAAMRRSGMGLSDLLFNPESGMMAKHPSRKLGAALRLTVEAAAKDPEAAGGILIALSNHMRDLANADREMRLKLRSTIDSMKNTAILFAPVIMGVTVGLYALLSQTFGEMNGAATMPAPYFIMVMGVYLLSTVATIMYFCSGIEHGRGRWKRDTAVALPVAAAIFCATSLGALMAF